MKIDLYADIACPWCLLGQHRLDSVLAQHFIDLQVDIEHRVSILMPDCPPEGRDIAELMRAKGLDPATIRARPETEARAMGMTLDLSRQPRLYPTLRGHTLIRLARERGTQHSLARALAEANFNGSNVNDANVLADIACAHGFTREEALRLSQDENEIAVTCKAAADTAARGIHSVPHFIFDDRIALTGNQSEADFIAAIRAAAS